jgi:hypothetical protein
MKNKNYKELETEKQKGKRRFVERRIQEQEAEKEIKEYDDVLLDELIDRDAAEDRLRELRKY